MLPKIFEKIPILTPGPLNIQDFVALGGSRERDNADCSQVLVAVRTVSSRAVTSTPKATLLSPRNARNCTRSIERGCPAFAVVVEDGSSRTHRPHIVGARSPQAL